MEAKEMNEMLARALIAEKYENLRQYECTKTICVDATQRRKHQ